MINATNIRPAFNSLKEEIKDSFTVKPNMAQYKGSDYSNAVRVERGISLREAVKIAKSDPTIDYFCFTKGSCMVLETSDKQGIEEKDPLDLLSYSWIQMDLTGEVKKRFSRIFHHGDTVFFTDIENRNCLCKAPGLSDAYIKLDAVERCKAIQEKKRLAAQAS